MRKFYIATLLGGVAIAAAGYAWAQGIPLLTSPTGTELITVLPIQPNGQPAATQAVVTLNQIRNSNGYLLVPTGGTVATTVPNTAAKVIATGAITAWTVTLPLLPFDGETVEIACSGGAASAITVNATGGPSGVTIVGTAFTTSACASGGASAATAEWIYATTPNVWYRIQ